MMHAEEAEQQWMCVRWRGLDMGRLSPRVQGIGFGSCTERQVGAQVGVVVSGGLLHVCVDELVLEDPVVRWNPPYKATLH